MQTQQEQFKQMLLDNNLLDDMPGATRSAKREGLRNMAKQFKKAVKRNTDVNQPKEKAKLTRADKAWIKRQAAKTGIADKKFKESTDAEDLFMKEEIAKEEARREVEKVKGRYKGICNMTGCTFEATWYNHGNDMYYCDHHAKLINDNNDSWAIGEFGHSLLTEGEYKEPSEPAMDLGL